MLDINFTDHIHYQEPSNTAEQLANVSENFFNFGGRTVVVLRDKTTEPIPHSATNPLLNVLKLISCLTIIIPLAFLILRTCTRSLLVPELKDTSASLPGRVSKGLPAAPPRPASPQPPAVARSAHVGAVVLPPAAAPAPSAQVVNEDTKLPPDVHSRLKEVLEDVVIDVLNNYREDNNCLNLIENMKGLLSMEEIRLRNVRTMMVRLKDILPLTPFKALFDEIIPFVEGKSSLSPDSKVYPNLSADVNALVATELDKAQRSANQNKARLNPADEGYYEFGQIYYEFGQIATLSSKLIEKLKAGSCSNRSLRAQLALIYKACKAAYPVMRDAENPVMACLAIIDDVKDFALTSEDASTLNVFLSAAKAEIPLGLGADSQDLETVTRIESLMTLLKRETPSFKAVDSLLRALVVELEVSRKPKALLFIQNASIALEKMKAPKAPSGGTPEAGRTSIGAAGAGAAMPATPPAGDLSAKPSSLATSTRGGISYASAPEKPLAVPPASAALAAPAVSVPVVGSAPAGGAGAAGVGGAGVSGAASTASTADTATINSGAYEKIQATFAHIMFEIVTKHGDNPACLKLLTALDPLYAYGSTRTVKYWKDKIKEKQTLANSTPFRELFSKILSFITEDTPLEKFEEYPPVDPSARTAILGILEETRKITETRKSEGTISESQANVVLSYIAKIFPRINSLDDTGLRVAIAGFYGCFKTQRPEVDETMNPASQCLALLEGSTENITLTKGQIEEVTRRLKALMPRTTAEVTADTDLFITVGDVNAFCQNVLRKEDNTSKDVIEALIGFRERMKTHDGYADTAKRIESIIKYVREIASSS